METKNQSPEVTFSNSSFSNYRNWGHISELLIDGKLVSRYKAIYYNRTWESYQYQSVMRGALSNYIDSLFLDEVNNFKSTNNIKKLSSVKKDELLADFKQKYAHLYAKLDTI